MQRIGKSDIKVGVGAGGEKRGEVISGDRANRKQRGGGTMKDCSREIKAVIEKMVIEGKSATPHTGTPEQEPLCPGKDIEKIP